MLKSDCFGIAPIEGLIIPMGGMRKCMIAMGFSHIIAMGFFAPATLTQARSREKFKPIAIGELLGYDLFTLKNVRPVFWKFIGKFVGGNDPLV